MKHSAKNYCLLLLVIVMILFLGYYRDFVFKTVNSLIQSIDYEALYVTPPSLKFLDQYTKGTLTNIKWLLTFLFSLAYLMVALAAIRIIFNICKYSLIMIGVYAVVMLLSGLFMILGAAFEGLSDRMYEFARYLMGMVQSPIILMIMIPAFKLSGSEPNNITN